jgi:proline dehydrogenase
MQAQLTSPRPALAPVRRLVQVMSAPVKQATSVLQTARLESMPGLLLVDALTEMRRCQELGVAPTLAYFSEVGESPRLVADACLSCVDALATLSDDSLLSLRTSALGYDADLLAQVLRLAQQARVAVQFDSQGPDSANAVFACVRANQVHHDQIGVTLPGRWTRSRADAEMACEFGMRVRVVKGQWADPLSPQFDERAGFLGLISRLAGKARHVSVATHDAPLAHTALKRLIDAGTPCELELTHGLPQQAAIQVARSLGVAVRNYFAYGGGCAPTTLGRSSGNPRALWWALRERHNGATAGG